VDVCHHMGHNDTGDVLSRDVSTFSTFLSGTYRHIMFQALRPYVAALLYANLIILIVVYEYPNKRSLLSILYIRVQKFQKLGSPRPLMAGKFNSKTHSQITFSFFEPLRLCLIQSLQKVLI